MTRQTHRDLTFWLLCLNTGAVGATGLFFGESVIVLTAVCIAFIVYVQWTWFDAN